MRDESLPEQERSAETAWRLALLNAVLGALFAAVTVSAVLTVLLPPVKFDPRTLSLVAYAVIAGVAWRARRLSLAQRVGMVVLPMIAVQYVLMEGSGFLPGIPTALSLAGALTAVWLGPRAAALFILLATANFLLIGREIGAQHLLIDVSLTNPARFSNWVRVALNFAVLSSVLAFCMSWVVRRVEENARERGAAHELLRKLNRRLENAKEEERRHLARELHDELGQSLTALKLQLKLGARAAVADAPAKLEEATHIVDGLIRHVRKLSVDLSPPLLQEAGLIAAVRAFFEGHAGLSEYEVELSLTVEERFSPELETTAFRVIQEAITNVLRHADAKRVRVELKSAGDVLYVAVDDDGRGFDVDAALRSAATGEHFGMVGMRERVSGIGGLLTVESRPNHGTKVEATLSRSAASRTNA